MQKLVQEIINQAYLARVEREFGSKHGGGDGDEMRRVRDETSAVDGFHLASLPNEILTNLGLSRYCAEHAFAVYAYHLLFATC